MAPPVGQEETDTFIPSSSASQPPPAGQTKRFLQLSILLMMALPVINAIQSDLSTNRATIIISGLGGSCSRVIPSYLQTRALFVAHHNNALDAKMPNQFSVESLLQHYKSSSKQGPFNLRADAIKHTLNKTAAFFDACEAKHGVCVFKEEKLTFALPFLAARENVCIIHTVREPLSWTFSNNFIGVHRWYESVFQEPLSSPAKSNLAEWQKWWSKRNHEVKTHVNISQPPRIHDELFLAKARLWSSVYKELLAHVHDVDAPQYIWRCGKDREEDVGLFIQERCNISLGLSREGQTPFLGGKIPLNITKRKSLLQDVATAVTPTAVSYGWEVPPVTV